MSSEQAPLVSVVVVAYNMARELPRTLATLVTPFQQGLAAHELEIILVDNGSTIPLKANDMPPEVRLIHMEAPSSSPVRAVNRGIKEARADLVGVLIDGARMASPGICRHAVAAAKLHKRPIIATLGFHLGAEVQMQSIQKGYGQEVEDQLLDSISWRENGYDLFSISCFAGSSKKGWFQPIAESNALFMPRGLWEELGGFDEKFDSPGGGLVNLDIQVRACALPDSQLITLLGEGTFHQVHGGVATNSKDPKASWDRFHAEYMRIRGIPYEIPSTPSLYLGEIAPQVRKSIKDSIAEL